MTLSRTFLTTRFRAAVAVAASALLAAACTTAPPDRERQEAPPAPAELPSPPPYETPEAPAPTEPSARPGPRENVAVAGLMRNARRDSEAGRLANAAATLERALRIEPRNPRLWHELARVRLKQGQYSQAATLAARSNSWAAGDPELRAANERIIEEARIASGR